MTNKKTAQARKQQQAVNAGKGAPTRSRPPTKRPKGAKARQAASARRNRIVAMFAIGFVIMLALYIAFGGRRPSSTPVPTTSGGDAAAVAAVTSVPGSALDAVGVPSSAAALTALPAGTTALTSGGKPEVFYIGAEYCPYCAAQRWPLIVALSRFGAFSGLTTSFSAGPPEDPANVPSFTFHGSTYTSQYISFVPLETETRTRAPLETPTAEQNALVSQFNPQGSIPFMLIGSLFSHVGASFAPSVLTGTQADIASKLSDPANSTTQLIDGNANVITAGICRLTGDQPTDVCTSSAVKAAAGKLPGA